MHDPLAKPTRTFTNRDMAGAFMTRDYEAMRQLSIYLELAEQGDVSHLLAMLDRHTQDTVIHPNAVLLMAVRLLAATYRARGLSATYVAKRYARAAMADPENDRSTLWLPPGVS